MGAVKISLPKIRATAMPKEGAFSFAAFAQLSKANQHFLMCFYNLI